ncbi:ROK family protein [Sphingobacterium sp. Mn56C]|uniref:ROK family protein n=1 Tax=Sphingobacterium sp. Mn56C TaxID=3395261 RepID=UPI003BD7448C
MSDNNSTYILACDIGGTHITSAIVHTRTWEILSDTISRNVVNSNSDAKSILLSWTANILACQKKFGQPISNIGIAMPGPFDYEQGISLMQGQNKYDALYKMNTSKALQENLSNAQLNIRYINDAAAYLQGEVFGQQREHESRILGITLGTGLGSSVRSYGEKAFDADLWKAPYRNGIFEEHLATRWFTERFKALTNIEKEGFKEILTDYSDLPEFQQLIVEYRDNLYDFLRYFSSLHQSSKFILGGNIAKAWPIIGNSERFNDFEISVGIFEEKAALIGAASLFE